jgi:hypothetical protein
MKNPFFIETVATLVNVDLGMLLGKYVAGIAFAK